MMVEGRSPERNACIAMTISAALCPIRRPAGVSTVRESGWQPEQDEAPGGASAAAAAPSGSSIRATERAARFKLILAPRKVETRNNTKRKERRLPATSPPPQPSPASGGGKGGGSDRPQVGVLERHRAHPLAGGRRNRIEHRRRRDRDGGLADT